MQREFNVVLVRLQFVECVDELHHQGLRLRQLRAVRVQLIEGRHAQLGVCALRELEQHIAQPLDATLGHERQHGTDHLTHAHQCRALMLRGEVHEMRHEGLAYRLAPLLHAHVLRFERCFEPRLQRLADLVAHLSHTVSVPQRSVYMNVYVYVEGPERTD